MNHTLVLSKVLKRIPQCLHHLEKAKVFVLVLRYDSDLTYEIKPRENSVVCLKTKSVRLFLKPLGQIPSDVAGDPASWRRQHITVLVSEVTTVMEEKIPGILATSRRPLFDMLTSLRKESISRFFNLTCSCKTKYAKSATSQRLHCNIVSFLFI